MDLEATAARMRARATVLHADADSFFAAVEQHEKPSLAGRPVLVGGTGPRGVVATASYEARRSGARSAMAMGMARRLCPAAAVLAPRFEAYSGYSAIVMDVLRELSPLVEPLSIDEAFVDLEAGDRADDPAAAAAWARARIRELTGLAVSVGAGRSKLVAKLASEAAKPDGLLVVEPEDEDDFLLPLPVRAVPGIGPATAAQLDRIGVRTVADLRRRPLDTLVETLGESAGASLFARARGIDARPVAEPSERKSVGAERTFAEDVFGADPVRDATDRVADEALARLARHGGGARTVVAKVRYADFTTVTRSVTFTHPTADEPELREAAHRAVAAAGTREPVRLLGVSFHALSAHAQLTLGWDDEPRARPEPEAEAEIATEGGAPASAPAPPEIPLDEAHARPGLDVEHATLGRGWVVHVRGREATVRFETAGSAPARSRVLDLDADPLVLVRPAPPCP